MSTELVNWTMSLLSALAARMLECVELKVAIEVRCGSAWMSMGLLLVAVLVAYGQTAAEPAAKQIAIDALLGSWILAVMGERHGQHRR